MTLSGVWKVEGWAASAGVCGYSRRVGEQELRHAQGVVRGHIRLHKVSEGAWAVPWVSLSGMLLCLEGKRGLSIFHNSFCFPDVVSYHNHYSKSRAELFCWAAAAAVWHCGFDALAARRGGATLRRS